MTVLVGSLALTSGQVRADNECGAVSGSGNARTVTCDSDLPTGVAYKRQNGLSLNVGTDGAQPIEIKPLENVAGIHLESWKTDTGDLLVTVFPVRIVQNDQSNAKKGIEVAQRGPGGAKVRVDSKAKLGADGAPLLEKGIYVWYGADSDALLEIINDGDIFVDGASDRNGAGIHATRGGAGNIRIVHRGEITSNKRGIHAYHGGAGGIEIINEGSIVSREWGIFARKDGLGGKVKIVSSGDIRTIDPAQSGINVDVRATNAIEPVEVTVEKGEIQAAGNGVSVSSRSKGAVTIMVMLDGSIGILAGPVGGDGVYVSITNKDNDKALRIVNEGKIFAGNLGIYASHSGTGKIEITNKGTIKSKSAGIRTARNSDGDIQITQEGTVVSEDKGIYASHTGAGDIYIVHEGSIVSKDWGIYALKETIGGKIKIISRGDIETKGLRKNGIYVEVKPYNGEEPIEINVERGTIKATLSGVLVKSNGMGAVTIKVGAGAAIGTSDGWVGGNGINVSINNALNKKLLTITNEGDIFARNHGIYAYHEGTGKIEIVNKGNINSNFASIHTTRKSDGNIKITQESTVVSGGRGIYASNHGTGNIEITNRGEIYAVGKGINAYHNGNGAIRIIHTKGNIFSGVEVPVDGATGQMIGFKGFFEGIHAQHDGSGSIEIVNKAAIKAGGVGIRAHRRSRGAIDITHEGSIESRDFGIFARHDAPGTNGGGIKVTSRGDITTTGYRRAAIDAQSKGQDGSGDVIVNHEKGRIVSHVGIVARSMRSSGSRFELPPSGIFTFAPMEKRNVELTVVSGGEILARRMKYDPDLKGAWSEHQVGWKVRDLLPSYGGPVGILVGTIDSQRMGEYIAAGDAPLKPLTDSDMDTLITDEVRAQFREVVRAANEFSGKPGSELNLGYLFDPRELVKSSYGVMPADLADDIGLDNWLKANGGAVLMKFLRYTLSKKEEAVLQALFKKEGMDAALAALPDTYTINYKNQIKWLMQSYNDAVTLIKVVDGGSIDSEGDGIKVTYKLVDKDNGKITVLVERGAIVKGHRYGVKVEGAGIYDRGTPGEEDDIRDQTVEVQGTVESTGPDGAGVYLSGGGTLIIGTDGKVSAASGTSVIANDPGFLRLVIETKEGERPKEAVERALRGIIVNEIGRTELVFVAHDGTALPSATGVGSKNAVIDGAFDVGLSAVNGGVQIVSDYAPRSRVYEALPSVLLGMNGAPGYWVRANAPRLSNGTWARATAETGTREPSESTSAASYRYRLVSLDLGMDIPFRDSHKLGFFVHHRIGSADVQRGGDIDVSGTGMGLSYTWDTDRYFVDLHAATTFYKADLRSSVRGMMTSNRSGIGHAVGIEAGHRIEMDNATVTPSLGLGYSSAKLGGFTDEHGMNVSSLKGWGLTSHMGVGIEKPVAMGRLFGSLGLEHEIEGKTIAVVAGTKLSSEARNTTLNLGGGMVFGNPGQGTSVLAGVNFGTDGSGHEIRGTLAIQF